MWFVLRDENMEEGRKERDRCESYVKLRIGEIETVVADQKETSLIDVADIAYQNIQRLIKEAEKRKNPLI